MQVPSDRYWARVLFKEFIRHFRRMTDEQVAEDIKKSMLDLEDLNPEGESFGSKMVRWSIERKESKPAIASRENGKKGGRPKKNTAGAPNGNNGDESTTACVNKSKGSARPSTDGDTRKDSRNITGSSNGASLESATSVENVSGSGKPKAQNDQRRTGGHLLPSSSLNSPPVRSWAVDVLSLAYSGEFGNVKLTQEQYSGLGIKFGNMQKLNRAIDSLSCKLENEEIKPVPKNHYAVLLKWASYREDIEEQEELKASSAPHYETVSEHNARIVRESDKWIDEHFPPKMKAANGK